MVLCVWIEMYYFVHVMCNKYGFVCIADRVIPNFFGICKMCTPIQTGWFDLWLSYLFDKYPDLIRAALIRYLLSLGIAVPEDQVQYMQAVFLRHRYGPFKIQRIDLIDGEQSSSDSL